LAGFDFEREAKRFGHVDVLIGSPPCQPFSLANRGGNGDAKGGLAMVAKFLEAVKELKPKYWVMENVPNIERTLRRAWLVDRKNIKKRDVMEYLLNRSMVRLDCSRYGVPQRRTRLFSGRFPLPIESPGEPRSLLEIIQSFPYPEPNGSAARGIMKDPLYGISIPYAKLRDHFMDSEMDEQHVRISRREKEDHNWAGRMRFPDDLERPSRTICATSVKSGRQAIVVKDPRKAGIYRTPTIRECATLQGFPVTFQFSGSTITQKQTLVGNAVPPPVARSIATAILNDMGMRTPSAPLLFKPRMFEPDAKNGHNRLAHRFPLLRPYRHKVPGTYASCRVDLDNLGRSPSEHPYGVGPHLREWRAVIYLEYAKNYVAWPVNLTMATKLASRYSQSTLDPAAIGRSLHDALARTIAKLGGKVPDASSLQAIWSNRLDLPWGPDWVLDEVKGICQSVAGEPQRKSGVPAGELASTFKGIEADSHGDDFDFQKGKWRQEPVDLYTMCSVVAVSAVALMANRGADWLQANWGRHYNDLSIGAFGPFPVKSEERADADLLTASAFA
jgi:DNA (cytosine-5)-methyltransferase 1